MGLLRNIFRRGKHVVRSICGQDVFYKIQVKCEKVRFGNDGASWCIHPDSLSDDSVIYSFGIGEDISFDLELIQTFNASVHAFDPTPRSIELIKNREVPEKFVLHEYGIANYDGKANVFPPQNPNHISHTIVDRGVHNRPAIEVQVHRLNTIMAMLGHKKIDLLKMDIEGMEYQVIEDFLTSGVQAEQMCVEFHHRWPEIGVHQTKRVIEKLNLAGFKIIDISPTGEEYTFKKFSQNHQVVNVSW
ncbi:MAG: FkbM family methyltransferase [Nitrospinae bacterium]|nr:FkbM family methyltransferase [Nitrospinota bacterium]